MALVEENNQLKQEKAKRGKYQLIEYPTKMKEPLMLYQSIGEGLLHYICPNCYDKDSKSITLQKQTKTVSVINDWSRHKDLFYCNTCKTEYITRFFSNKNGVIKD